MRHLKTKDTTNPETLAFFSMFSLEYDSIIHKLENTTLKKHTTTFVCFRVVHLNKLYYNKRQVLSGRSENPLVSRDLYVFKNLIYINILPTGTLLGNLCLIASTSCIDPFISETFENNTKCTIFHLFIVLISFLL